MSEVTIDASEYLTKKNQLLQDLDNTLKMGTRKAASIIKELVEITEPIIASGAIDGYKTTDTAKYLWNEVVKNNIDIPYRTFIYHIPENLKRKYSESATLHNLHEHDFIKVADGPDGPIRKCICTAYEIGGMVFLKQEEKTEESEAREDAQVLTLEEERQVASKSPITLGLFSAKYFMQKSLDFVKAVESKCRDPKILKDFENSLEFKEISKLLVQLEDLYNPQNAKTFYTKDEGECSIMNQMLDETNFRAPATLLQKAMCATLGIDATFRQWAHKLSISPRQHQRIRQRLKDWPDKKPETVIRHVLGSVACPKCNYNLITRRKNPGKNEKIKFGKFVGKIPAKYQKNGINPLEMLYEEFLQKLKVKK